MIEANLNEFLRVYRKKILEFKPDASAEYIEHEIECYREVLAKGKYYKYIFTKATCKELGIIHRHKYIRLFLKGV